MVGEKAAVANNDPKYHRSVGRFCHGLARGDFCKRLQSRTYCALSNLVKLALPLPPLSDDLDCARNLRNLAVVCLRSGRGGYPEPPFAVGTSGLARRPIFDRMG